MYSAIPDASSEGNFSVDISESIDSFFALRSLMPFEYVGPIFSDV